MKNQAFAFIKPHAAKSQAVLTFIEDVFDDAGVRIAHREVFTGEKLSAPLIDRFYASCSQAAVAASGDAIVLPESGRERFKNTFGKKWETALRNKQIFSAQVAMQTLDIDTAELCELWATYGADELYDDICVSHFKDENMFVANGFYPQLRAGYLAEGAAVVAMTLDFDMPWRAFIDDVAGCENPAAAYEESVRGYLYDRADALAMRIDAIDNVIHVSDSPFAALCEKMIWFGDLRDDPLFAHLRATTKLNDAEIRTRALAAYSDKHTMNRFALRDTDDIADEVRGLLS